MATLLDQLPIGLSTMIGRHHESAEAQRLLLQHRQLTLTGPGGCGKTRLALGVAQQLADNFAGRVYLVEIASLDDPALVPWAVADSVGVPDNLAASLEAALIDVLAGQQSLLLLDNCEHLIDACADLITLLRAACPQLHILVTSREVLGISDEIDMAVPVLPHPVMPNQPDPTLASAEILDYESVQLFLDRAWDSDPGLQVNSPSIQTIARLCSRLEGLPLAIQLVASSEALAAIEQLLKHFEHDLYSLQAASQTELLQHQSLIKTLDWSYAMLNIQEQACFRRLAVFSGGWSLEAAALVCADIAAESAVEPMLAMLARKSLVTMATQARGPHYRMLEPVRQYALMRLQQCAESSLVRDLHLAYYVQFVRRVQPELIRPDQRIWSDLVTRELPNLRAAMHWSIEVATRDADPARVITALNLPTRLERFWVSRGRCSEGEKHLIAALTLPGANRADVAIARAVALNTRAVLRCYLGLNDEVRNGLFEALDIARSTGDRYLELVSLRNLGTVTVLQGAPEQGEDFLEQALTCAARLGAGADHSIAWVHLLLGTNAYLRGDNLRSESEFTAAIEHLRVQGDTTMLALTLRRLGMVMLRQNLLQQAGDLFCESLSHNIALNSLGGIAAAASALASVFLTQAQLDEATRLLTAVAAVRAASSDKLVSLDQNLFDANIDDLRRFLGQTNFDAIWEAVNTMTLAQAIARIAEQAKGWTRQPLARRELFDPGATTLSTREREVVALIARGRSNREIARLLVVETKTIEAHITRIINKLGVNSRVQIATWAVKRGFPDA